MVRAASSGPGFVNGSGWMTFGELVDALGNLRQAGRRTCTPLTSRVVIWSAARKLGPGPFGAFVHEPAFARAALELFSDLKSGGLSPPAFTEAVSSFPASRIERARYLARLYGAYEAQLRALSLADRDDEVLAALEALRARGLPPTFADVAQLEISGLHDFPPSRARLLLELARQCDRAGVSFRLEVPGAGSAAVDAAVDPMLSLFEREAQRLSHVDAGKIDLAADGRPLAALGRHLFGEGVPEAPPQPLPLELVAAATARHEARTLARAAADRVAGGVPPERIAIVWPELADDAEWTVEALEELGIPARTRRGIPLQATTVGRVALELPLLADDAFPAARVAELIGSRYLPEISSGRDAHEAPAAILAMAGVRDDLIGAEGGKGAYEVRLSALLARLEASGAGSRRRPVRALLDRSRRLIAIVSRISAEARAAELLDRWWHAVSELGLVRAVRQTEGRDGESSSLGGAVLRALARDQAAFEALQSMVSELSSALRDSGAANTRIARRIFHRWLEDAALDFNLAARGPRGGAVHVLSIRELGGRAFEHVCLGGLADGRFPGRDAPHPLFPDEDRARVNAHADRDVFRLATGEGERRISTRLAQDRLAFHLALSASRGGVTVSVAGETPGGAEQTPSPFWDELVRLTGAKVRVAPLRAVPLLDEVRTERELRERAALELLAPAALRTEEPDAAATELGRRLADEPWAKAAAELTRIEDERLRFFSREDADPGRFSGAAAREDVRAALEECFRFDEAHPLSASRLDAYGNCAFQGFLSHALGLDEPEEAGEEIDARGRGSFWHNVLELLFPMLQAQGLVRATPEAIPSELIDAAVSAAAEQAERKGPVGHPAVWRLGQERARRMVRRLLASSTRGAPFEGLEPSETELRFGRPTAPERWQRVAIPGRAGEPPVHVEGKIDRIDAGKGGLGVLDYKSSAKSGKAFAEALLTSDFQVPLYLFAARAAGHEGPLRGGWLSMKDGSFVDLDAELARVDTSLDDVLAVDPAVRAAIEARGGRNLSDAVHRLVAGLREGRFPARAEDCTFCAFRRVCRIGDRTLPENGEAAGK